MHHECCRIESPLRGIAIVHCRLEMSGCPALIKRYMTAQEATDALASVFLDKRVRSEDGDENGLRLEKRIRI